MMYRLELSIMNRNEEGKLKIMERKIVRQMLGTVKVDRKEYRWRPNREILELLENTDVMIRIKQQQARSGYRQEEEVETKWLQEEKMI